MIVVGWGGLCLCRVLLAVSEVRLTLPGEALQGMRGLLQMPWPSAALQKLILLNPGDWLLGGEVGVSILTATPTGLSGAMGAARRLKQDLFFCLVLLWC